MKSFNRIQQGTKAAFTLAELMVVIVIIGLLATMVVPSVFRNLFKANVSIAKSDITTLEQAVTSYMMDHNGTSPDSLEELITEDEYGDKYIDRDTIPTDPWKNEYIYLPGTTAGSSDFVIMTYGADGVEGGEGKERDITNSMIKNKEI